MIIAAHGNSLRALVKYLDDVSEADIVELNIPTGVPLVYELDDSLRPLRKYYLGDPEAAARKAQAVANQGKGRDRLTPGAMADFAARFARPPTSRSSNPDTDIGLPGEFPYTRGIHPTMYRGRPWTMRQYAGFGSAQESNARYRYLLAQGSTGLSVAFDLPTQIGYDSDHPLAAGEVGRVGVAIDSIEDMARAVRRHPTRHGLDVDDDQRDGHHPAGALRRRGHDGRGPTWPRWPARSRTTSSRNTSPAAPTSSRRGRRCGWCPTSWPSASATMPRWHPVSVSGYHIREAGATATQEVAFTLAHACAYVEACVASGLDVNAVGARLSFFFNAHSNFLEEIAKFRAARRLWARLMRDRFGATEPRAQQLRFHAQTAGSTLTAQQPDTNIVRVTLQALAAVLGGAQSIHTNGRDEALALPTEESATIALRTQQILLHESGVARTVDPAGGSYAVEELTEPDRDGGATDHRRPGRAGRRAWRRSSGAPCSARSRNRPTARSGRSTRASRSSSA